MKKARLKLFLSSRFFKIIKIIVGISIFMLFIRSIDFSKIEKIILRLDIWNVIVLLLLTIARNIVGAIRFKVLIKNVSSIRLFKIMEQYFIASLYNNFLPTAIGGDAVRMVLLSQEGLKKEKSVIYVITERIIGFYSLLFIGYSSSLFWNLPRNISQLLAISFFIYSLLLLLLLFPLMTFKLNHPFLKKIYSVFEEIRSNLKTTLYVFLISLVYQFISVFISYYIAISIGLTGCFLEFLTLVPIVWFLTMIPVSFGGIGIREVSFAYLLGLIGVTAEQSTIISIGTYFTLLISGIIGGIFIFRNFYTLKLMKSNLNDYE